ncbi:TadE/TadG family type IV pilus assembly protein [Hyphococcus luteus]|uniref:TadE/TadG family type IV pilus assembly protein n=1 Tax=Hyphococcus luteus TaxID=2058213 RepID=UPI0013FDE159|nr:TadE family protein [Marinicaulis flavus]
MVAIEYALLFPVLLAFVLGLIDAGRVVWTQATLSHAVDVAARCGAVDAVKCGEDDAVKDYVVARAAGVALDAELIDVEVVECGEKVAVSHPVRLILPWTGKGTVMLKAEACYPL